MNKMPRVTYSVAGLILCLLLGKEALGSDKHHEKKHKVTKHKTLRKKHGNVHTQKVHKVTKHKNRLLNINRNR